MAPSIDMPRTAPPPPEPVFTPSSHGETPLLVAYSARTKAIDVHPSKPWVLSALFDGTVVVHDLDTHAIVKTFRVSTSPVRTAKFIARMQWIVTGSDDRTIRVFHVETNELVTNFEAHEDYVRSLGVHPTLPLLFSCGDDKLVKVWDWTKNWASIYHGSGHAHYVMSLAISPSGDTVATASLDHEVRLWHVASLESEEGSEIHAADVLIAHNRGVNAVAFDATATTLVTASDDHTMRVWDVATKRVAAVVSGHTANVTSVLVYPTLPLIVSGAEDNTVRLCDTVTFRCVGVWEHGLGRAWTLAAVPGRNAVAIGYDRGMVVVTLPPALVGTAATAVAGVGAAYDDGSVDITAE